MLVTTRKLYLSGVEYIRGYFDKHTVTSSVQKQMILFLFVGSICFVIDMLILVFLVEIVKINAVIGNGISVTLTTFVAYLLNVKFIFEGGKFALTKEVSLFFIFSIIGFFLNEIFMYILTVYVLMWYVLAKVIITLTVALFNFSTRKWFIFSK